MNYDLCTTSIRENLAILVKSSKVLETLIREYELKSGRGKNEHRFSHERLASSYLTYVCLPSLTPFCHLYSGFHYYMSYLGIFFFFAMLTEKRCAMKVGVEEQVAAINPYHPRSFLLAVMAILPISYFSVNN